jgi:acetyl-CoA carboxylase carboxyl transferase subunit beta
MCQRCHELTYEKRFARMLRVCPGCGWHARLSAPERIAQLFDPASVQPIICAETIEDPLSFTDRKPYSQRLREERERTGLEDAVLCVRASIDGNPLVAAVMDFRFLGGSLGCAAGERIVAAADLALRQRVPLLLVTASGGARMQEGALSLMQMAKTTQALLALDQAGQLTITLVTDPTYGGVAASFATQADVILAESGARLGFAGPRVIRQTIRQELPAGFQTAEFLAGRGLIDGVHPRSELRRVLGRLLAAAAPAQTTAAPAQAHAAAAQTTAATAQAHAAPGRLAPGRRPVAAPVIRHPDDLPSRDPWDVVRLARQLGRPTTLDYAGLLLDGFCELNGDRLAADCPAIVGGIGRFERRPVMLIGHQKGHCVTELAARNFGMPSPAGYRKAARFMRLAAKLAIPVVSLIDTPGAYPGVEAERDGQPWAISENLRLMSGLTVPVVAVVTGEGGSGGALALALADRVLMQENCIYSVISPEGCAAILWKDAGAARRAAQALRIDARELLRQSVVDEVIREPGGGAHCDPAAAASLLRSALRQVLDDLARLDTGQLLRDRARRFRAFGMRSPAGPARERQCERRYARVS